MGDSSSRTFLAATEPGELKRWAQQVRHLESGDPVCIYPFVHCEQCQFCAVKEYRPLRRIDAF